MKEEITERLLFRWVLYHTERIKKEKQLKYNFSCVPKTGLSVVSATQLGIYKGELLKLLGLRILVLAQLNDLCPKHKQRFCRASQAQRLASFSKMRLEDVAARTDHVAFMEAVEGHMVNLCLISRNLFVMGQS